jgi:cytosine/adenosine deaminase-related metal-dependent hydrolase
MLTWATSNGAKALEMEQRFGSFTKGTKPGLVAIKQLENNTITSKTIVQRLL